MKLLSLSLLLVFTGFTQAVTLAPVADPQPAQLAIDPSAPNIPCDQVVDTLGNFNAMYLQHNDAVGKFLEQLVEKLNEWHGQLQPLEGKAQLLPVGTFSVLQDGASKVDMLKLTAEDNVTLLSTELARIQDSLAACTISSRPARK